MNKFLGFVLSVCFIGCATSVGSSDPDADSAIIIADSGTPVSDGGTTDALVPSDSAPMSEPVHVTCGVPTAQVILTGSDDQFLRTLTITNGSRPIEVRSVHAHIGWSRSGLDGFVAGPAGTKYFHDVKLKEAWTGVTWMGPTEITPTSDRRDADMNWSDSQMIMGSNSVTQLIVTADTSVSEEDVRSFTHHFFAVTFREGDVDAVDSQTREPVAVEYDASCLASAEDVEFLITPRFPDVTVDLHGSFITSPHHVIAGLTTLQPLVPIVVINEGDGSDFISEMQIEVRATTDTGIQITFESVARACVVTTATPEQTQLGLTGMITGDTIRFQTRIPSGYRSRSGFTVYLIQCEYQWPAYLPAQTIYLRAGAIWDSFRLANTDPTNIGRVTGTLALDGNRLATGTVVMGLTL